MITPDIRGSISLSAYLQPSMTPRTLTAIVKSQTQLSAVTMPKSCPMTSAGCGSIVVKNVERTELPNCLCNQAFNLRFHGDIDLDWNRDATGALDRHCDRIR